jgi:starch-binding outer membrane protein, SusD/RagB family
MLKKNKAYFFIFLMLGLIEIGCKKFVSINPPVTRLVTASVFNSDASATAAQTVIYVQMNGDPYQIERMTGLSSDELKSYSVDLGTLSLFTNSLSASQNAPGTWAEAYYYIYEENAILEGLQRGTISPAVRQQLTGEAKFVRAFWYFYLTNMYGDAPIITSTDYKKNTFMPRASQSQVYQQIVADLQDAQNLLNSNYVDASDTAITKDRVRPTKWAATAMLARVYLYTADYTRADSAASAVISNSNLFNLLPMLDSVFTKTSKEAIWQIMPAGTIGYTTEGKLFILTGAPSANPDNSATLSDSLLNAFEKDDQRKVHWVGSTTAAGKTYLFPYKYKVNTGTTLTEYSMLLRLAEQYLIRAEARAQGAGAGVDGAIQDINAIRHRAGLADYSGSADKASLLSAILQERRVELFVEGHRWFDLKRTNNVNTVMSVITPQKGGIWNSYDQLYPIPLSDIQTGSLLQNQGY